MRNFLRYADVAELLQVKVGTLYSMVSRREIPHVRVSNRLVLFDPEHLKSWLKDKEIEVTAAEEEAV